MAELIHQHSLLVTDKWGVTYVASVYGQARTDGTWKGWLEFEPLDGFRPTLSTGQETTQPSRATLAYWATGLEPTYLDGALARAQGRLP